MAKENVMSKETLRERVVKVWHNLTGPPDHLAGNKINEIIVEDEDTPAPSPATLIKLPPFPHLK